MEPIRMAILMLILQKQVEFIISAKPTLVVLKEGDNVDFTCRYSAVAQNNSKFFCQAKPVCRSYLTGITPPERWRTNGRFALYDNITANQFVVHMESLEPEDSGTYWCVAKMTNNLDLITVFQLNVKETTSGRTVKTLTHHSPDLASHPSIIVGKRNLPMFVTVVSCISALVVVSVFTLCLVFTVRKRRRAQRSARAREMSADYEIMNSGVLSEPCNCPDCETSSSSPQNPSLGGSRCTNQRRSKQTESMVLEPLTQEKVPERISQYQGLDLSAVEDHVYYGINSKPVQL
ncbi:hypothetical protein NL108_003785 [Boleophthalmus pectinirostris]|nr:hypothetical protein NL108_003785 [Boleophthalmus pectinirostris]